MGLFHHDEEPETADFMGLVLDADSLHTPDGVMPLTDITRSDFHRTIVSAGPGPEQTSTGAVVGGAVVGGVAFGAAGAIVGGLAGSTVKEEGPEQLKTNAVQLIFESPGLNYTMDVPREQEGAAITFADTVTKAVKRHKK